MSCGTISNVKDNDNKAGTYPESRRPTFIEEDQNESSPETTKHGNQANDEAHNQGGRN
jgi:hypothetical protein